MPRESESARTEKERLIFDAALKVIKAKGFHQARMSDIAKEAGISYGLVYHYFKNKEDLFETIIDQWWDGLFDILEDIRNSRTDVQEKLGKIVQYYLGTYHRYPELVTIFITEISRSSTNLTPETLKKFTTLMSRTDAVMTEGQKGGVLRKGCKAPVSHLYLSRIPGDLCIGNGPGGSEPHQGLPGRAACPRDYGHIHERGEKRVGQGARGPAPPPARATVTATRMPSIPFSSRRFF